MIIDCIGCLHGNYPELEGGDLLIVTGDLTARHTPLETVEFLLWVSEQKYRKVIWISGNHDTQLVETDDYKVFFDNKIFDLSWKSHIEYLSDSGTEFEGLKIWGSPWTKTFPGINPKCKAFTVDTEEELAEKWKLIPDDIDILITHGPPYGVLDKTDRGKHVGSKTLFQDWDGGLKLHVFSHIHEAYGEDKGNTSIFSYHYINCSHVNERYQPVNKPIRIILK